MPCKSLPDQALQKTLVGRISFLRPIQVTSFLSILPFPKARGFHGKAEETGVARSTFDG